jgi:prefoldin subunit 5
LRLENISLDDRRQFLNSFITQAQTELDKARGQMDDITRKLAEAIVRHEALKASGLDTTMAENTIKARASAVEMLNLDIARLEKELNAYQSYAEAL